MNFRSSFPLDSRLYYFYSRVQAKLHPLLPSKNLSRISLPDLAKKYHTFLIHAGLKSLSASSSDDAFNLILGAFPSSSILCAPAFTPSFRSSGFYSPKYSRPEVGSFSRKAWSFSSLRTLDPIHDETARDILKDWVMDGEHNATWDLHSALENNGIKPNTHIINAFLLLNGLIESEYLSCTN